MFNQLCFVSPTLKIMINPARWYMPLKSPFCTFYNFTNFIVTFLIQMIIPTHWGNLAIKICCIVQYTVLY